LRIRFSNSNIASKQQLKKIQHLWRFGDKVLKLKHCKGFSLKPFLKRLAFKQFFEQACGQAIIKKGCISVSRAKAKVIKHL
jgi:hypothetical protein